MLKEALRESASVKLRMAEDTDLCARIKDAARRLKLTVVNGGTIYTCGNGGSACDAMHFAEELVGRYKRHRDGIRAHHLMDAAFLTCWSNDWSFGGVFTRQVATFVTPADALVVFSTSGDSDNVFGAACHAQNIGAAVIALTGDGGGRLAEANLGRVIAVPSNDTARIQEAHIALVHYFCEYLENQACQPHALE